MDMYELPPTETKPFEIREGETAHEAVVRYADELGILTEDDLKWASKEARKARDDYYIKRWGNLLKLLAK